MAWFAPRTMNAKATVVSPYEYRGLPHRISIVIRTAPYPSTFWMKNRGDEYHALRRRPKHVAAHKSSGIHGFGTEVLDYSRRKLLFDCTGRVRARTGMPNVSHRDWMGGYLLDPKISWKPESSPIALVSGVGRVARRTAVPWIQLSVSVAALPHLHVAIARYL
jgi:hypothetical protein